MKFSIQDKTLTTPDGQTRDFEYGIKDSAEFEGMIVVVLKVPRDKVMTENVFGISDAGEMLWRIERIPETSSHKSDCYVNISLIGDGFVRIVNFNGWHVDADVKSGRILNKIWLK